MGESREIGRLDVLMDGSLPGLGKGMVMEFFQICGMLLF